MRTQSSRDRQGKGSRLGTLLALALAGVGAPAGAAPGRAGEADRVYFNTDVVPLLTKLGCNSGGCHGKATGQNGFRLSLLGFEPEHDYEAIAREARGRRLSPADPRRSLILLKATGAVAHGGGKRLE